LGFNLGGRNRGEGEEEGRDWWTILEDVDPGRNGEEGVILGVTYCLVVMGLVRLRKRGWNGNELDSYGTPQKHCVGVECCLCKTIAAIVSLSSWIMMSIG